MASVLFSTVIRASLSLSYQGVRSLKRKANIWASLPLCAGRSTTLRLYSSNEDTLASPRSHNTTTSIFTRGQEISAVVTQFGPLGASVTVNGGDAYGLILQSEIHFYRDKYGVDVKIGDSLDAYVERVREDGKLHVFCAL